MLGSEVGMLHAKCGIARCSCVSLAVRSATIVKLVCTKRQFHLITEIWGFLHCHWVGNSE